MRISDWSSDVCSSDLVGYAYGDLPVLDGVSFSVAEGETAALIGPSGCGKSTLLNLVGGLLPQQGGRIRTVGAAPAGCLNPLTFVFQDFALLPWRSVAGNVALALEPHKLGKAAPEENGGETCRGRGCQYGEIQGVGGQI